MATAWRLTRPEYARALDGAGNRKNGARWNSPGRGVVYASINLSLCVLETFIHLPDELRKFLPVMMAVKLEIPENSSRVIVDRDALPGDLASSETATRCRKIGDEWLTKKGALLLSAPSFVVPMEQNIMINPAHPEMDRVKIISIESFTFDQRLIKAEVSAIFNN
jgi:RES domain-containing protein